MGYYRGESPELLIRRLEDDLWQARRDIIRLMPSDVEDLLSSYHSCHTREDFIDWQRDTIDAILEQAKPNLQGRSPCPLCRRVTESFMGGDLGFTVPEGLKRHLEGYGNVRICPVTEAAFAFAKGSLRERLDAADDSRRRQQEQRRKIEILYLIEPWCSPRLLDEGFMSKGLRNKNELAAAEERLHDLGFQTEKNGNIVCYKLTRGPYVVLADPRERGRINFVVYGKNSNKRSKISRFYLDDSWKNDLTGKLEKRLGNAIACLAD